MQFVKVFSIKSAIAGEKAVSQYQGMCRNQKICHNANSGATRPSILSP